MKAIPYTFTVIRYVHDRAANESLNIGVIVFAPQVSFIGVETELRFERLSKTFAGFDGDAYRQTLSRLTDSISRLRPQLDGFPEFSTFQSASDANQLLAFIWPDIGLSFTAGPLLAGIATEPLEKVTAELFRRMVSSQTPTRGDAERRSDEEVWVVYNDRLREAKVSHRLVPKTFTGPEFAIKFDHAFQNRKWHAIQPVTMDFVRAESLQDKATHWLGNAMALKGHLQLAQLFILLGAPRLESHRQAYEKAKNLLHKMPVKHEIVEEREAEAFARQLADFIRDHSDE